MESDLYLKFENKFRGSREQIIDKLSAYDELLDQFCSSDLVSSIIDIGSGRGEWLEKCKNKGINATGIEINPEMIKLCEQLNLNVIEGNALEVLKSLPSKSADLVTAFHIIEHLSHDQMKLMLEEILRILKTEGCIILETPSIDHLAVATKNFYSDPTHITPINPDLLVFQLEQMGFHHASYYLINGGQLEKGDRFSLARLFYGVAQDLLVLGTVSQSATSKIFSSDKNIINSLKTGYSSTDVAKHFDKEVAKLKKDNLMQKEAILELRRKMLKIQNDIETISILLSRIKRFLPIRIALKCKNLIYKIINIFVFYFFKLISLVIKIFHLSFIFNTKTFNIVFNKILKLFLDISSFFGSFIQIGKIVRKFEKDKKLSRSSSINNEKLLNKFHSFPRPQEIFKKVKFK